MGGQILTYFIGQCGCQIAGASWELYCLEHCISPDGKYFMDNVPDDISFYNFFSESKAGQFVPRSLFVDLEPTVIDEMKMGPYRKLFNPDNLINGFEDAANNFARGFYSCGKSIVKSVVKSTRKLIEACDNVQAFMVHHSFGGGTGSGFTSILLEYLSIEYAKCTKVEFGVFPSPTLSVAVVEPYNTVLALHTPMENADVAAFFENESLFKICSNNLLVDSPLFTHLNRMAAQVISGMTCSMRFEGPIGSNLIDFQTNLVPYPRIHFPLISFSPFLAPSKVFHNNLTTKELTTEACLQENQMAGVDPSDGIYMSCCLMYRGDVNVREVNDVISHQKSDQNMRWVDWCPTGYKVGINYQPMIAIPASGMAYSSRSLTLLCNSTSVKQVISRINHKFMLMYNHKSFLHWYIGEGMEESEFKEAINDVLDLEKDFEVLEETTVLSKNDSNVDHNEENSKIFKQMKKERFSSRSKKSLNSKVPSPINSISSMIGNDASCNERMSEILDRQSRGIGFDHFESKRSRPTSQSRSNSQSTLLSPPIPDNYDSDLSKQVKHGFKAQRPQDALDSSNCALNNNASLTQLKKDLKSSRRYRSTTNINVRLIPSPKATNNNQTLSCWNLFNDGNYDRCVSSLGVFLDRSVSPYLELIRENKPKSHKSGVGLRNRDLKSEVLSTKFCKKKMSKESRINISTLNFISVNVDFE